MHESTGAPRARLYCSQWYACTSRFGSALGSRINAPYESSATVEYSYTVICSESHLRGLKRGLPRPVKRPVRELRDRVEVLGYIKPVRQRKGSNVV